MSRQTTKPGFKHDLHSTGHIFIQANPLIDKDELGLMSRFGLDYVSAECYFTSLFPDGSVPAGTGRWTTQSIPACRSGP